MRRIYSPPPGRRHDVLLIAVALLATLLVFLVLPLTQLLGARGMKEKDYRQIQLAVLPPPPPPPPEEPPPPEDKQSEPKPELNSPPRPISLTQLELALNPGTGNALQGDFGLGAQTLGGALEQIDVFDLSELDQNPSVVSRVTPIHPPELARGGVEGWATVTFIVDAQGQVRQPRAQRSSHPAFEGPAIEAIQKWTFRPGMKDGEPVGTRGRQKIVFRMK